LTAFLNGNIRSAASDITENGENTFAVSENVDVELFLISSKMNVNCHVVISQKFDDWSQSKPDGDVLHCSENTAVGNRSIEDVTSAKICAMENIEALLC
jgi:hypothetical protein